MRSISLGRLLASLLALGGSLSGCDGETELPPMVEGPLSPPVAQSTEISDVRPPAISGGTLLGSKVRPRVLVADPDRDRLVLLSSDGYEVLREIALEPGDEPGRITEDRNGLAYVALRGGGAVASVDLMTGDVVGRRDVCAAPRGLAIFSPVDGSDETLIVACASGELVELTATPNGPVLARNTLEPDLRDVVVTGDGTREGRRLLVSSFRQARVLTIDANWAVIGDTRPLDFDDIASRHFVPTVAWRLIPDGDGARMLHQRATTAEVEIAPEIPSGYGSGGAGCDGVIVHAAVTRFDADGASTTAAQRGSLGALLLPVDAAIADDEVRTMAVVSAGSDRVLFGPADPIDATDACADGFFSGFEVRIGPEPIAVAWSGTELLVQTREPSMLVVVKGETAEWLQTVSLGGERRFDSGHQLFHRNPEQTSSSIACASCHPEGREDGHTWNFTQIGERRTQSLEGNVLSTAPFHWDGDLATMNDIMGTVFEHRMGGQHQSPERVAAIAGWLEGNTVVGRNSLADVAAIERGRDLFESDAVGCASCHSGENFTNKKTMDVGTGKAFQVPGLIGVRNRAPYMHDGCAPTLHARFEPSCGGDHHGNVDDLSEREIDDLVAYMESL